MHTWIKPLYSIITYYVGLKIIDFIVEGIDRSKGVMIITVGSVVIVAVIIGVRLFVFLRRAQSCYGTETGKR